MKKVRFGIIGGGLMGREFASAAARWCHLLDVDVKPEPLWMCAINPAEFEWYETHFPGMRCTTDYKEVLADDAVEAVYIAVPHNLHQEIYCAAIEAGKHLFGEKPFGIDLEACEAILACMDLHPGVFVRCCTQMMYFPGVQRLMKMIDENAFGQVISVNAGFLHSSDLNPDKALNWKRMIEVNGEYGVMGDLGMHVCALPFRAGWTPKNVRAVLSNIMKSRPDGKGGTAPCETWDNATLLCEAVDPHSGEPFPMTLRTERICPGESNTWYIEVLGTQASARYTTRYPTVLEVLEFDGKNQDWKTLDLGYKSAFPAITGGIFEFGFSDAILQMWGAFLMEMTHGGLPGKFMGPATPQEAHISHRLFTAALKSQAEGTTEKL